MNIELLSRTQKADTDRPDLLFIHGGFHGAWCWEQHFLPWFEKRGWAAHALSLRGHGESDGHERIRDWTLADYGEDVASVIDRIGRPVVVIGHSMGAVIGEQCWRKRDDIVGMVLLAGSPLRASTGLMLKLFFRHPITLLLAQLLHDPVRLRAVMSPLFFSPDLSAAERLEYEQRLSLESPHAIEELFSRPAPSIDDAEQRPVLVIGGADDVSIPLSAHEEASRAFRAQLEICAGAHDLMLDPKWMESALAIEAWLGKHFGDNRSTGA